MLEPNKDSDPKVGFEVTIPTSIDGYWGLSEEYLLHMEKLGVRRWASGIGFGRRDLGMEVVDVRNLAKGIVESIKFFAIKGFTVISSQELPTTYTELRNKAS